jgi:hypothetical protein
MATVTQLETEENPVLAIGGASPYLEDPSSFTNDYDTSRLQLIASSRTTDGDSLIGAIGGTRASIGLETTLINQRVQLPARPAQSLDLADRGDLIEANVTPLKTLGTTAQVKDDLTTVSEDNTEEQGYKYGFTRLVVDFLIEQTHRYEEGSVGEFNSPGEAGRIEDLLTDEARVLEDSAVVYSYEVNVGFESPTQMLVTIRADVAEPIRFIKNEFTIGSEML